MSFLYFGAVFVPWRASLAPATTIFAVFSIDSLHDKSPRISAFLLVPLPEGPMTSMHPFAVVVAADAALPT